MSLENLTSVEFWSRVYPDLSQFNYWLVNHLRTCLFKSVYSDLCFIFVFLHLYLCICIFRLCICVFGPEPVKLEGEVQGATKYGATEHCHQNVPLKIDINLFQFHEFS